MYPFKASTLLYDATMEVLGVAWAAFSIKYSQPF